jgi:hypothetical protein
VDGERPAGVARGGRGQGGGGWGGAVGCMAPVSHCATDGSLIAQPTSDPSTPSFHVVPPFKSKSIPS